MTRTVLFELAPGQTPSQAQISLLQVEMLRIGHDPKTVTAYVNKLRGRNGNH